MKSKLDEFVKCLDKKQYFNAHEVIEEIWYPRRFEDNDEMRLLKGFINSAVCFELRKRGKESQSQRVWKNYLKYKPLLYKIDSPYLNQYHIISQHVEKIFNLR